MGMFDWTEKPSDVLRQGGVIAPDERLPWPQTAAMGVQHVIAMFGATVLAPILMGFDPNIAILMSGIGTLIFFFITGGQVPSYLGSSFAFIGVVIAATGYAGKGPNAQHRRGAGRHHRLRRASTRCIGADACKAGAAPRWIERLMPPVVTGAVVAVIGLNLAGIPIKNMAPTGFDTWMQARDLRLRRPGRGVHARHGAAPADPGGPDRREHRLRRADQRPRAGQADRPLGHRRAAWFGAAGVRGAGVRRATRCC